MRRGPGFAFRGESLQQARPSLPCSPARLPDRPLTTEEWQWVLDNRRLIVAVARKHAAFCRTRWMEFDEVVAVALPTVAQALVTHGRAGAVPLPTFVAICVKRLFIRLSHRLYPCPRNRRPRSRFGPPVLLADYEGNEERAASPRDDTDELAEQVQNCLRRLTPRYRTMLWDRVVEGKTLRELSSEHGVTRARVDQIVQQALASLRQMLGYPDADLVTTRWFGTFRAKMLRPTSRSRKWYCKKRRTKDGCPA